MAAQSQIVQIQPGTLDLAATGVHLVPLDDIGHADTVEAIIGEDRAMVAPVLPYGVLVVNGSSKKLTAIAVTFRGLNNEGQKKRVIIKLRLYPPRYNAIHRRGHTTNRARGLAVVYTGFIG